MLIPVSNKELSLGQRLQRGRKGWLGSDIQYNGCNFYIFTFLLDILSFSAVRVQLWIQLIFSLLLINSVAVDKPLEATSVTKMKTGSSSSDSSDSSDSEDSENGNIHLQKRTAAYFQKLELSFFSFSNMFLVYFTYYLCNRAGSQAPEEENLQQRGQETTAVPL